MARHLGKTALQARLRQAVAACPGWDPARHGYRRHRGLLDHLHHTDGNGSAR